MAFNPYKHMRLAGAITCIAAVLFQLSVAVVVLGLGLVFVGVVGSVDLLERRLEVLEKEKENNG